MNKDKALQTCLDSIKQIELEYKVDINDNRIKAMQYYNGEALGNEITGRSQVVTQDVGETVEWMLPFFMDLFASAEDVVRIEPSEQTDEAGAKMLNDKINHDLTRRNKWFLFVHDWIKDCLLVRNGFIKSYWKTQVKTYEKLYIDLSPEQIANLNNTPGATIKSDIVVGEIDKDVPVRKTLVEYKVIESYPVIENTPPEEVLFPLTTIDFSNPSFIAHRVSRYKYEVEQSYGDGCLDDIESPEMSYDSGETVRDIIEQRFNDLGGTSFIYEQASKNKYIIYECYIVDPDTGKSTKVVVCGKKVLKLTDNPYGRHPFFTITPTRIPHRAMGRSIYDAMKDIQQIRTAIVRGMLDNVYFNNAGRWVVDETRINIDDFLNNNVAGGIIRGDVNGVKDLTPPSLQPWVFQVLEYVETMGEMRTGRARMQQGVVKGSLHRTFRGQSQIMNKFAERMAFIAKVMSEGIAELINYVVDLNIKFLDQRTQIRYKNNYIDIDPTNIAIKYDIEVNVGIGSSSREEIISQMQQLLAIFGQLGQAGIPVFRPQNIYNSMKTLLESMGRKNVSLYITEPETLDNLNQLSQTILQGIQSANPQMAMQGLMQLQQVIGIAPQQAAQMGGADGPQGAQPMNPFSDTDQGFESSMGGE